MTVKELKQILDAQNDDATVKIALDCDNDWGEILTAPTFIVETPKIFDEGADDEVLQTDQLWLRVHLDAKVTVYSNPDHDFEEV